VLGCDLKLLGSDWLTAVVTLQSLSKIQGRELSVCYESVLSEYSSVALQYPLLVSPQIEPTMKAVPQETHVNLCKSTDLQKIPPVVSVGAEEALFAAQ